MVASEKRVSVAIYFGGLLLAALMWIALRSYSPALANVIANPWVEAGTVFVVFNLAFFIRAAWAKSLGD